jgi:hypothetical protein
LTAMISQQAKDGFDHTVIGALKTALCASSDDHGEVDIIVDTSVIKEKKVVLLTVSSYLFRVMTVIYFTLDQPTKNFFAATHKVDPEGVSDDDFLNMIGECGNIFCGAINRALVPHYPHIGMSTPNVLDRECIDFMQDLGANYIKHFKIVINGGFSLHASLYVCDFADIDFAVDMTQAEESTGELEMF